MRTVRISSKFGIISELFGYERVVRNQEAAQMNNIRIDPKEFQKSITKELDTIKNRVRNLIGSSHWGEEGRYKEAILRNVIKRFLPSNLSI